MAPEFEWDAQKAAENLKNHRVGFDEALTVFADPLANILTIRIIQMMSGGN